MEMLAWPTHSDVKSLLCSAARAAELERFDVILAVAAARCSSQHETLLTLHLNLMADTVGARLDGHPTAVWMQTARFGGWKTAVCIQTAVIKQVRR
jgi:hypothetical protein